MIITERNTKKFKDIVNTIIVNRGETISTQRNAKQKYNFDLKGEIKPMRVGGVNYENIISYYWVVDGSGKLPIRWVTYEDYLSFIRDVKITEVIGGDVEIVSKVRNVKKKADFKDFTPEVGMELKYQHCNVVITKVTPKTFKFKYDDLSGRIWGNKEHSARVDFAGYWCSNGRYFSLGHYTAEEKRKIREQEMQDAMWR